MSDIKELNIFKDLTIDQTKASKEFINWLDAPYEGFHFVLSGNAGSGKTFLSTRFLKLVEEKKLCWTVVAPTHKAVEVLKSALRLKDLRPTWYPSTIHRLLRLKLKRKGDLEICEETDLTSNSLEQLQLVLIDESSMIDSKLLEIVIRCSHQSRTRLVFVGDPAQLPPVGENISPVFSLKRCIKMELLEVVRHQGPVLKMATLFRNHQLTLKTPPCFPTISYSKGNVGSLDKTSWLEKAKKALKEASLIDDPNAARILCYTNKNLENLVPHARRAIHGDMADQLPVLPGEVLITRSAVMAPAAVDGDECGEDPDMVFSSNRELVVNDVIPERFNLSDFGIEFKLNFELPTIETLIASVRSGESNLRLRLMPQVGTEPRRLLDQTLKYLKFQAGQLDKKEARSLWRKFFLIKDSFASLGPASALTVHRSQGSTFGEVFISSDVFWPANEELRKKLIYVAITRAKESVWLMGDVNNKIDKFNEKLKQNFVD